MNSQDKSTDLTPAWTPSQQQIQTTHIWALMQELSFDSYPDLHTWSVQHQEEFWQRIIQRLNIQFQQPYRKILDTSRGIETPNWLVDAQLNIVESCFQANDSASAVSWMPAGLLPVRTPAIIFQPEGGTLTTWSYRQLRTLTNRVANGLVEAGFHPGDAIGIAMPMTAEAIAIYLGIIKAGCIVVSIADSFAAPEIATRLGIAKTKAIFTQDIIQRAGKQLPLYAKVVAANAPQAIVLPLNKTLAVELRPRDIRWSDFLSDNSTFAPIPTRPASPTNILFSSGTTGTPKAIPWTQTTPIKCAADAYLHQDIHPGEVLAWPTNLGWMMGPWLIYASLINRATIALYYGAPTGREFGEFVQNAQVTMLGLVPSLVSTWKVSNCMDGLNWSRIKAFSSTGECSNPTDMRFLMGLAGNKPVIEYCGGTEIGGAYITGTLVQPCIPATFSTPALGLDVVIVDEEGQPSDKGEVLIVPPSIGLSTVLLNADHHQVYCAHVPQNLRRHGDQMERLPNGYYRGLGRVDDTMNLGGVKVSSTEIERALNTVEAICETAAIAIAPPGGGPSQLVVYAVLNPDIQTTEQELKATLQAAIAQSLNPLFKIHQLVIVDDLPRNASNKVMRRVLRENLTP